MTKIKCVDGMVRTQSQYNKWIANLAELAKCEPGDLTKTERMALIQEGWEL